MHNVSRNHILCFLSTIRDHNHDRDDHDVHDDQHELYNHHVSCVHVLRSGSQPSGLCDHNELHDGHHVYPRDDHTLRDRMLSDVRVNDVRNHDGRNDEMDSDMNQNGTERVLESDPSDSRGMILWTLAVVMSVR